GRQLPAGALGRGDAEEVARLDVGELDRLREHELGLFAHLDAAGVLHHQRLAVERLDHAADAHRLLRLCRQACQQKRQNEKPDHCGGLTPPLLTETRPVAYLPSLSILAMVKMVAPFFRSASVPGSKLTTGVFDGTRIFFSPSLYFMVISLPPVTLACAARLALVMPEPGFRSHGMWPEGAAGGMACTSTATSLPSFSSEVTPTYL